MNHEHSTLALSERAVDLSAIEFLAQEVGSLLRLRELARGSTDPALSFDLLALAQHLDRFEPGAAPEIRDPLAQVVERDGLALVEALRHYPSGDWLERARALDAAWDEDADTERIGELCDEGAQLLEELDRLGLALLKARRILEERERRGLLSPAERGQLVLDSLEESLARNRAFFEAHVELFVCAAAYAEDFLDAYAEDLSERDPELWASSRLYWRLREQRAELEMPLEIQLSRRLTADPEPSVSVARRSGAEVFSFAEFQERMQRAPAHSGLRIAASSYGLFATLLSEAAEDNRQRGLPELPHGRVHCYEEPWGELYLIASPLGLEGIACTRLGRAPDPLEQLDEGGHLVATSSWVRIAGLALYRTSRFRWQRGKAYIAGLSPSHRYVEIEQPESSD